MAYKKRTLAAFGQIALPLAIADLPLVVYINPFFAQDIGVDIVALGVVLLLARIADVLIDPMIGILSDRSVNWPLGRRKAWVLLGIPIKMLGIYMIFFSAPGHGPEYVLLWLVVLYLGWTMIQIPYGAWGAELSGDYNERTRITGWRTLFAFIGIFLATLAPLFVGGGVGTPEGLTPVMQFLGLWSLIIFPISGLILGYFVPEPPVREAGGATSWLKGLKIAFSNGPYMRVLIATTIGRIGSSINTTVVFWFFLYVLALGPYTGLPMIVYLLAAVFGVPLWVILGDRIAKHNALIIAVVSSVLAFGFLAFVPPGNVLLTCIIMGIAGLGGGAAGTLGLSIAADVLDLDEMRSRQSRAGLLLAFWNMGGKLADAVGGFVALMVIAYFGFNQFSATQSPDAMWGLTLTYIIVPWPFFLISIALLWRFPISGERQRRIRAIIERRAERARQAGIVQVPVLEPAVALPAASRE